MSFFASKSVSDLLFKGWTISTAGGMAGSCIAVVLIAILFETLKSYKPNQQKPHKENSETTPLIRRPNQDLTSTFQAISHLKKTLLFIAQLIVGYFLMLVAMTYNVWLFLAVVGGCGIGYFLVHPYMEYYLGQCSERSHPIYYINRDFTVYSSASTL